MTVLSTAACTRRDVLRSLVGGSLLLPGIVSRAAGGRRCRPLAADPLAPKPPHFAPKAKRVIFLFSTGGVSHMDTFDHKPKLFEADGKMLGVGGGLSLEKRPLLKPRWDVQARRQVRHAGQRPVPAPPRADGRHLPDPLDDDRQQRALPGDAGHPHRLVLLRPAEPRLVGQLRPGHGEPEPAVVRRPRPAPALRRRRRSGPTTSCRPITRARASCRARSRSPTSSRQPATADLQELELGLAGALQPRAPASATATTPTWPPASARSRPRSGCSSRPRRRSTCRRRPTRRSSSTAWSAADTTSFGWQCLVARRLAERGVRFIELIDTGSSNNWDSHGDMAAPRPAGEEDRPADRRAAAGPEAARHARRHAGRLDHASSAARRAATAPRAAAITRPCFSSWLAGGGVKGGIAYGETDEIGATVGREQGPRPRLPRHDPAPAGPRPREAHLPPRRPRLPPDRRAWRGRSRHFGMRRKYGVRSTGHPPAPGVGVGTSPSTTSAACANSIISSVLSGSTARQLAASRSLSCAARPARRRDRRRVG